ncbi:MAG: phosphoribosylamine--glycine ligase [Candidatus Hydrogenedentota bacterium]|nr:MAG: phosphoribosylamine--glycine ligase [Candidatus Hydrogenedentota bacterium]
MKILVVGSGGREDALAWRLSQERDADVFTTPGNCGTARWGENLEGDPEEVAARLEPDLIVVGPEAPLAEGLGDRLRSAGFAVVGPSAEAARVESSKSFAKELMKRAGVPTARSLKARNLEEARKAVAEVGRFSESSDSPRRGVVVKADGLAAGKGVTVCRTEEEAENAVREIFVEHRFGEDSPVAVIEEILVGREASMLAVVSSGTFLLLPGAEDHKAVGDGDSGPNTGGMGAISPTPVLTSEIEEKVSERIFQPMVETLFREGLDYRGILYAGLMISPSGDPSVVEFNCRFGDPEAQAVLPRVRGPLLDVLQACATGERLVGRLEVDSSAVACVIAASEGYPVATRTGMPIEGLSLDDTVDETGLPEVFVSGVKRRGDIFVTAGGRVGGFMGRGETLGAALEIAYRSLEKVRWEGMHFRRDIGRREKRGLVV